MESYAQQTTATPFCRFPQFYREDGGTCGEHLAVTPWEHPTKQGKVMLKWAMASIAMLDCQRMPEAC